jgi:hypothetical protein
VILSANQLPERYQNCTWLHDTLADKRTIFRSLRTPLFFQSHIPSLADKRSELKQKILAELNRRSQSEIASLCQMTRSAQLPNSGERLAELLSTWTIYLAAVAPEPSAEIEDRITTVPEEVISSLHLWHFLAVSPHSAALGGQARFEKDKVRSFFPDTLEDKLLGQLAHYDLVRLKELNEYLTRLVFKVTPNDLSSQKYWDNLSEYQKDKLLEILEDRKERIAAMEVEKTLRLHLAQSGDLDASREKIEEYVHGLRNRINQLGTLAESGLTISSTTFLFGGALLNKPSLIAIGGLLGAAKRIMGTKLIAGPIRRISEFAIPTIQIVNFVKRQATK